MMKKLIVLSAVLLLLLSIAVPSFARDPVEFYADIPDSLREPLSSHSGLSYTFVDGFRDIDEGKENAFLILEQNGESRIHIFNNDIDGWRLDVVSRPLPKYKDVKPQIAGWATYFWVGYELKNEEEYTRFSYTVSLQEFNEWKILDYSWTQMIGKEESTIYASFSPYFLSLNKSTHEVDTLPTDDHMQINGVYDYSLEGFTFPMTISDLESAYVMDGYAMVCNPNPADRLNLRKTPAKDSKSLGKYYNGTIVKILNDKNNGWVEVDIEGITGYFMKDFLAYGEAIHQVPRPEYYKIMSLDASSTGDATVPLYIQPSISSILVSMLDGTQVFVLGDVGDDWCHVLYRNTSGYVQSKYLSQGNG